MIATSPERVKLLDWYGRNRARSAALFELIHDDAFYERPIPLRHPFAFYEGHIPAFSFLTVNVRALGEPSIDTALEGTFERGIDPATVTDARRFDRSDWPSRETVAGFAAQCDARVRGAFEHARIENDAVPRLVRGQAAYTALEHEAMHDETLLYIVHQLDYAHKRAVAQPHADHASPKNELRSVAAGTATLGADRDEIVFGWDNEFERTEIHVPAFGISSYPVTNGQWLDFIAAGGPKPSFWIERDGHWYLRAQFEALPLPLSWPVYVTHDQAEAYARWAGMRLPSEAEFHRAAFGTPSGTERPFPWGAASPSAVHGNLRFPALRSRTRSTRIPREPARGACTTSSATDGSGR